MSRANRGVDARGLEIEGGVEDKVGDSPGGVMWLWLSLARTDRGAPRPAGFLVNLLSVETDVGKSSKDSNSVPSPKLRRRVGRVSVRLAVGLVLSVLLSSRLRRKDSGRFDRDNRE